MKKQTVKTLLILLFTTVGLFGQSDTDRLPAPVARDFDNLASTLIERIEFEQGLLDSLTVWNCPAEYQLLIVGFLSPSSDPLLLMRADALRRCFQNNPKKLRAHLWASVSPLLQEAGLQQHQSFFRNYCIPRYVQWLPPLQPATNLPPEATFVRN